MSKSFIYNLILTVVAIVVFIFIGASVYDAFTRNPVNRTADDGSASSVSGQIEAATPDATQPAQPTAASDVPPVAQDQQQAEAAYDQTNDPTRSNATQDSANSAGASGSEPAATDTPPQAAPAPAPTPAPASPRPETSTNTAPSNTSQPNAPTSSTSPARPATRGNPDLRAVIPPVPTAPPRAEGVPPPNTTSQDMYNATNSGMDNGNVSDSFPAPVSNFPAPVTPGATGNAPGANNDEQQRLQELRNQKQQLRRDLGF